MIGGTVVEVIELDDKIWINCEEESKPKWDDKNYKVNQTAVYVEKTDAARCVENYDTIWWQGEYVLWTPRLTRVNVRNSPKDIKLKKIGSSGVKRPSVKKEEVASSK